MVKRMAWLSAQEVHPAARILYPGTLCSDGERGLTFHHYGAMYG